MAAEDFFTRWSKKKTDAATTVDASVPATNIPTHHLTESRTNNEVDAIPDNAIKPLPTQEDVDKLTHDSDYSAFMSQGVDESVKRSAMKKLFTDPHFNIMDGLDIYIEDYNKFEPISPALLASLNHAKALLDPLSQLKTPLMSLLEKIPEATEQAALDNNVSAGKEATPAPAADLVLSDDERKEDYAEQQESQEDESLKEPKEKESSLPGAIPNVDNV